MGFKFILSVQIQISQVAWRFGSVVKRAEIYMYLKIQVVFVLPISLCI